MKKKTTTTTTKKKTENKFVGNILEISEIQTFQTIQNFS